MTSSKPVVYVAGPYTKPDPIENIHVVSHLAVKMIDDGVVTPVVPHMTMLLHLVAPRPVQYWYDYDLEVMARCDAVLRVPGESTGADAEETAAYAQGLPVFYDLEDVYQWARTQTR